MKNGEECFDNNIIPSNNVMSFGRCEEGKPTGVRYDDSNHQADGYQAGPQSG
jgi:hypothetical protein